MKNTKYKYILLLLVLIHQTVIAQNSYDIRLKYESQDDSETACYIAQLRSAAGQTYHLGGQNYRLYYDADNLAFQAATSQSLLSPIDYSPLVLHQNLVETGISNVDGFPNNSNIGFLNFSIDLTNIENGGTYLHAIGNWVNTAEICCDKNDGSAMGIGLGWARPALSTAAATAFVEVSEWVESCVMVPAIVNEYFDGDLLNDVQIEQHPNKQVNIYPNPFFEELLIETNIKGRCTLRLWSSAGLLVFKEERIISEEIIRIQALDLTAGIYYFQLDTAEGNRYVQLLSKGN